MVIGDSSRYDEDYLYSQKRLIKLLLKALGSATYSQGNPTSCYCYGEIIHKDPSCFQMLDDAGLPEAFLASVVSGVLPASKALACLPTGLGAICLNNKGLEAVKESSALRFLVDTFTRRKYLVAMNEGVVLLANAVEELLRHVSSLRSTGVDIIIEIITKLASLGEGKCSESSSGEGANTAMETDSNDKTNEGHDLVSVMDPNADGISGEQFVQLCIFHVMVLVHRTMENSETCRLFVEKGGIEILLKLLLRPSITQSSEGMPIALHSTLVFKGFTQHHSVPLARAFCFSLRDHLKRALEFGDSNKDVLEDIGRLQREVLWQVALLQGSELEKELESTESSNDVQKTNASTNESDDQRFSSFRQYLDPLLRRRVSGWSVESQFSDLISIYRDIGRVTGGSRRTGSENYFSSRFSIGNKIQEILQI
ncbi:hypothetical protein HPP92_024548 [Vanilla planifolia]|uniref:DUF913 domain-containing protein n=1 Tax=Vanilla planifolia TaxID=51239 RepID=A0A835PJV0_VANPL|nr:hypothetical protein HPP92_024548 [Vanilla planifolia]